MKHFIYKVLVASLLLWSMAIPSQADVKTARIFSSNMVLQQGQENPVWGWADKGEKITISFAGKTIKFKADKAGKWSAKLPSLDYGGPYAMTIKGKNSIQFDNILIGEVWVCSGQSNMEWKVKNSNDAEKEIAAANYPMIRLFTVAKKVSKTPVVDLDQGEWLACTPENIPDFSAVGYFFGRHLNQELKVPVGLIHTSWGGTVAETWTSSQTIENDPDFKDKLKELAGVDMTQKVGPNAYPTLLFNGMLNPIIPYGIQGAIWYQGESNASRAKQYQRVFPEMINDWRTHWNKADLSFHFVSLANFKKPIPQPAESEWAELREAQTKTLALPKTGMAMAIDLGEAGDIHPRNKQDVGKRLALSALKTTYGKKLVHSGPMYQSVQFEGNQAIVKFTETGSGLMANDKYGYVNCFSIAGADHKFVWAKASISGDHTVVVYSEEVKNPVAVRFGWADNPDDLNLYNKEGLPANPFRTDDWPGITK